MQKKNNQRVTIRQVAEAAGVAASTVSMVFHDHPAISASVRTRVQMVAEKLKYHPARPGRPILDHAKKNLPAKYAGKIAIVTDDPELAESLSGSLYQYARQGAEKILADRKYDLIQLGIDSYSLPCEVRGVLYIGNRTERIRKLVGKRPVVRMMGSFADTRNDDHVTYDNREAALLAARYAIHRGYERVAVIGPQIAVAEERRRVFEEACRRHRIEMLNLCRFEYRDLFDFDTVLQCIQAIPTAPDLRPQLLFSLVDDLLPQLYPALTRNRILPGQELEVLSCNNDKLCFVGLDPRPHIIDLRVDEIGRLAAFVLLNRLENPAMPVLRVAIQPELLLSSELDNWWRIHR